MLKYGLDFVVARENKYYLSLLLTTQVHVTESGECKDLLQLHPKKRLCMLLFACEDIHVVLEYLANQFMELSACVTACVVVQV